jgi:DNA-binding NarL/FixJ family response regulator
VPASCPRFRSGPSVAAARLAGLLKPDAVLMDIHMPALDGVQATALITAAKPSVRVVILTMYRQDSHLFEAVKAGARATF